MNPTDTPATDTPVTKDAAEPISEPTSPPEMASNNPGDPATGTTAPAEQASGE